MNQIVEYDNLTHWLVITSTGTLFTLKVAQPIANTQIPFWINQLGQLITITIESLHKLYVSNNGGQVKFYRLHLELSYNIRLCASHGLLIIIFDNQIL